MWVRRKKESSLTAFKSNCTTTVRTLEFNVYGNPETLYGIETFFPQKLVTFYDELHSQSNQLHTVRAKYQGRTLKIFGGEWHKSRTQTSIPADAKKFGQKWNEFIYKTVNLYDEKDLYEKVRTKYYRGKLKFEAKGQHERVQQWSKNQQVCVQF